MTAILSIALFLAFAFAMVLASDWKAIAEKRLAFDREVADRRLKLRADDDARRHAMLQGVFDSVVPAVRVMAGDPSASPGSASPRPIIYGPWAVPPDDPVPVYTQAELDAYLAAIDQDPGVALAHDKAREAAIQLGQIERYCETLRRCAERQEG